MSFALIAACMFSGIINVASLAITTKELSVTRMLCDATEADIAVIYNIQIRRKVNPPSNKTWETLAEIESSKKPILNIKNDKYLFVNGFLDTATPNDSYLSLDIENDQVTDMDDETYRCEMTYKSKISQSAVTVIKKLILSIKDHAGTSKDQSNQQHCEDDDTAAIIVGAILGITNICAIVYGILLTLNMRKTKYSRNPAFQGENKDLAIYTDHVEERSRMPTAQNEEYLELNHDKHV